MSSPPKSKIPNLTTLVSIIGSASAAVMVTRTIIHEYCPPELQDYLYLGLRNFFNKFSTHLTFIFYEFDKFQDNQVYSAAEHYLSARMSPATHRLKVTKTPNQKHIVIGTEINEEFTDNYKGVKFYWSTVSKKTPTREYYSDDDVTHSSRSDLRSMELTFHRKHRDLALNDYLPFIVQVAEKKKREQQTVKLFTVNSNGLYSREGTWKSVNLDHPSNFATLAMDSDMKEMVMKDLDRFKQRREYYRKVGKAWKRGYLLYGPPGTGKSSLIAAISNYLKFDIYDLQLTDIKSNSELRTLLMATANRSILVVEDIDCSATLHDRVDVEAAKAARRRSSYYSKENEVTLSGFLNFIDGLWSSCGDERIIIFTTNHKDKLDPALIRPGRMDVHIHLSYCTPCAFRVLVNNYFGINEHNLFQQIEDLMMEIVVTPAEIAEQLLKDDNPDIVLNGLIEFFDVKRMENEEAEAMAKMMEDEELAATENEMTEEYDSN